MLKIFHAIIGLGLLYSVFSKPVNLEVQRTIDASKAIVKIFYDVKVGDFKSSDHYELLFPRNVSEQLAFLSVEIGEEKFTLTDFKMYDLNILNILCA